MRPAARLDYPGCQTESRTSELSRLGNVLEDARIKADSVASSITTKSVRAMVKALIDGERRARVLADLARDRMRSKIPDQQWALEGRLDDHHALMCPLHLEQRKFVRELRLSWASCGRVFVVAVVASLMIGAPASAAPASFTARDC